MLVSLLLLPLSGAPAATSSPNPLPALVHSARGCSPAAPATDALDGAFELARRLKGFSARYALKSSLESGESELRLAYRAPDAVRVDRIAPGGSFSMWYVDGVFAVESHEGDKSARGRFEVATLLAEHAPIEAALRAAFPEAEPRAEKRAAIGMTWGFDAATEKTTFGVDARMCGPRATPLGWLATLRRKAVEPVEDGDLLRFSTDGHCRIALSKTTGFVQSLEAESPKGKLTLDLRELAAGDAPPAELFVLPAGGEGAQDIAATLERGIRRLEEQDLRGRIYAAAGKSADWDDATRVKLDTVLRAFHASAVAKVIEPWRARTATINATVAERLRKLAASGKTAEEIAAARERERSYLAKQLDDLDQGFTTQIAAPEAGDVDPAGGAAKSPRAEEILAREVVVIREIFQRDVREPVLRAFDAATQP